MTQLRLPFLKMGAGSPWPLRVHCPSNDLDKISHSWLIKNHFHHISLLNQNSRKTCSVFATQPLLPCE
jgi:hypothetical protein